MRWVKIVISTLIALAVIPSIVKVINNLSGYEGNYELIIREDNFYKTVPELFNLVEIDDEGNIINYLYVEADGNEIEDINLFIYSDDFEGEGERVISIIGFDFIALFNLDRPEYSAINKDYVKIILYINKKPLLSPGIITLISLTPLIFISGLITYQYKNLKIKYNKR